MRREEPDTENGVYMVVSLRAFSCSQQCTRQTARVPPGRQFPDFCVNFSAILFMAPHVAGCDCIDTVWSESRHGDPALFSLPPRSVGQTSESGLLAFDVCHPSLCTGRRVEREKLFLRVAAFRAHAYKYSKRLGKTIYTVPNQYFSLSKVVDLFVAGLGTCPNPAPHSLCLKVGRKPSRCSRSGQVLSKVSTPVFLYTLASGPDPSWLELPFLL